jgi:type VI protein secretion system component VasK
MISLRRIFGLMLLFLFFEAAVAVVTTVAWPAVNVFLACLAMTALAIGVWVAFALVTRFMMRPRVPLAPAQMKVATLPNPKPSAGDDGFALEMTALVREANRRLVGVTQGNGKREQPTVASLPLFLVVGAEGAGKTSALVNSGLEPHLLAGEAAREGTILPTRACNLWLAEGAIFADVSGRVVMQEAEHWEKTLRILAAQQRVPWWRKILFGQQGPQPNLRGVIVVSDANLFVRATDPQRISAFARTLNERLQAVGRVFGKDFPVYVVFSKCDALPSFPEFFAHLSDAEGRRLLGVTLPLVGPKNESADVYTDREGKRLTTYFNRLYMSLADKRMVFLAREEDARKKSLGYEFPRELKKVRSELIQFLLDVFRANPLQLGSRLRGFYFAGQRYVSRATAVAENSVADFSVVKRRAEATIFFGTKPQPQPGAPARAAVPQGTIPKWTFLTEVFHDVILKDRAGSTPPRVNVREQSYRHLAFGAAGTLCLILSLLWVNSWRNNRQLLNETASTIEAMLLVAPDPASPEAVAQLEAARGPLVHLLQYDRDTPLSYRWGLYSGKDPIAALDQLYFDRFRGVLMSPMLDSLTRRFLGLEANLPVSDDVYTLLKAYRMITSQGCPPDDSFLSVSLLPAWSAMMSAEPDTVALAQNQMQFYVSELKIENPYKNQITENTQAVTAARTYLQNVNGPDKLYRMLVDSVNHDKPADSLTRYAANYTEVMTGPSSIDGAYTRDGFDAMIDNIHSHKQTSGGEACVIGNTSTAMKWTREAASDSDVQDLYVKNYVQHWKAFLEAHHVVAFSNTTDAAHKLRILADNNRSPLLALVYMASSNTNVAPTTVRSRIEDGAEQAKGFVNDAIDKLRKKDDKPIGQPSLPVGQTSAEIMREFEPVHAVVDPTNSQKWLNDKNQEYVKALENLSNALQAIPPRIDRAAAPDTQAVEQATKAVTDATTALHALEGLFPNTPSQIDVDLKNLLREPINYASAVIVRVPVKAPPPPPPSAIELARPVIAHVNRAERDLCASVASIESKYPFDGMATQEATAQDLNQVFAPSTGSLAQFILLPEVSKAYVHQGRAWAAKPDFPATYSQPFLLELNTLSEFSEELYSEGGSAPRFDYTVTLDGTGKVPFELDVDGHVIKFTPGKASIPTKLVWPPLTTTPTKLTLKTGLKGGLTLPVQSSGPWSLLHLLQGADDQSGNLFTFRSLQFASRHVPLQDSKGNPVTIQIRVDSIAGNVFGKGYFAKLRCDATQALQPIPGP